MAGSEKASLKEPAPAVARHWTLRGSSARPPFGPTHAVWRDEHLDADIEWRSRAHRKGRFPRLHPDSPEHTVHIPRYRFIGWDPDNVSYWVALLFTLGSVAWVINGFYLFLPTGNTAVDLYASGYSALVGGTLFTIGAYLGIVEALNTDRVAYFGYHVHRAIENGLSRLSFHPKRAHRDVNPHYDCDASEQVAPTQADDRSGSAEPAPQAQLASLERQAADRPAVQPACAAEAGLTGGTGWLGAHKVAPAASGTAGAGPARAGRQPGATLANGAPATGKGWDCEMGWAEGGRGAQRARKTDTDGAEPRAGRQPGVTLANGSPATGKGWDDEMGWAEGGWGAQRARPAGHDKGHGRAPPEQWAWVGARWHDIGFVAAFVQMLGASLFQLSVVAGAPELIPPTDWQLLDALLWTPQARRESDMASMHVVGAMGFIIASAMLLNETQHRWWQPKPLDIGWHVAFWNMVGALGFWFSAFFGYFGAEYLRWGTSFSTFWGAWAFLIGSYLQLLEALNKQPMSVPEVFRSLWQRTEPGIKL